MDLASDLATNATSENGKNFLDAVCSNYETNRLIPVLVDGTEWDTLAGSDIFGVDAGIEDAWINWFYSETRPFVEAELFAYAVKEGYLTTEEMINAEISYTGRGIESVEDKRNALGFVFDGARLP